MNRILFPFLIVVFGFLGTTTMQAQRVSTDNSAEKTVQNSVITAYPNPTKGELYIKSKNRSLNVSSVVLYSILGTKVASYNINRNSSEIDLGRLRPGKYLIKFIMSDGTEQVQQIIKQ